MTSTKSGLQAVADDLERQTSHWLAAATTFLDAEEFASEQSWSSVEARVGLPLRRHMAELVRELLTLGRAALALTQSAKRDQSELPEAGRAVQLFRQRFAQVETTLDFFGDAVNSRTSPQLRAALQALDGLASQSMEPILLQAGIASVPVLSYVDKGMGASIIRSGVRLWAPGSVNPVAAIKIVRHNLYRPTSLFHETGHQVANLIDWNAAFEKSMRATLLGDRELTDMWVSWTSEITADIFAFLHTGYASVTALFDVVGDARTILRWPAGDPHPIGWLRTILGCAFCRHVFGPGPWDELERAVLTAFPLNRPSIDPTLRRLLERSQQKLPSLAEACLNAPIPKLGHRPMTSVIDPARVAPSALSHLEDAAGASLWTSPHWRRTEGIRIVALAGLREAQHPEDSRKWIEQARNWMTAAPVAA